jgi:hypothetical protein
LALLLCGERLRRLFVARPEFLTDLHAPLAHDRICQSFHDRGIELGDDMLRSPLGGPQAMPEGRVKPWDACLVDRRRVGSRRPPGLGHHHIGLELTGTDLRQRACHLCEGQVDMPGQQILDDRRRAAIGHELKPSAGGPLEVSPHHIRSAAGAADTHCRLAGIFLEPRDQFRQVLRRQTGPANHPHRTVRNQRYWSEIIHHVEREREGGAVDDVGLPVAENEGVAIGRGMRDM